jgi:hypothetical protein
MANRSSLVRLRPHLEAATWLGNVHLMISKLGDTNSILESIWLHRDKRFGGDPRKKLGPSSSMHTKYSFVELLHGPGLPRVVKAEGFLDDDSLGQWFEKVLQAL